jgi:hypothetical protein
MNRASASVRGESSSGRLTQGASYGLKRGNTGGGGSGPRPIYAPVPSIPDDMRDELMQPQQLCAFTSPPMALRKSH